MINKNEKPDSRRINATRTPREKASSETGAALRPGCKPTSDPLRLCPLTPEQRKLVEENIGLVAVHLKRYVTARDRLQREWDDLFQEGCMGLIEAARRFKEERKIPFAAFALPRIHNAVSKAMHKASAAIYVPRKRKESEPSPSLQVFSLSTEAASNLVDRRQPPALSERRETIGDRLARQYRRAIALAKQDLTKRTTSRKDRKALIDLLTQERLLIPQEDLRRPLRQIARDTSSSYARVAQCDKQLNQAVRQRLEADPEFAELRRRAQADPRGAEQRIDDETEQSLARASADEFSRRFHRAPSQARADMLHRVLRLAQNDTGKLVRRQFERLTRKTRHRLLMETAELRTCSA